MSDPHMPRNIKNLIVGILQYTDRYDWSMLENFTRERLEALCPRGPLRR